MTVLAVVFLLRHCKANIKLTVMEMDKGGRNCNEGDVALHWDFIPELYAGGRTLLPLDSALFPSQMKEGIKMRVLLVKHAHVGTYRSLVWSRNC